MVLAVTPVTVEVLGIREALAKYLLGAHVGHLPVMAPVVPGVVLVQVLGLAARILLLVVVAAVVVRE